MYTLTLRIFLEITVLSLLLMCIPAATIFLFVRRRPNAASHSVILTLSLAAAALLFLFLKTAALNQGAGELLSVLSIAAGAAFVLSAAFTCLFYLLRAKKSGFFAFISPDLQSISRYTEDIVLFLDWNGRIAGINREEALKKLIGRCVVHANELEPLFSQPGESGEEPLSPESLSCEWRREITVSGESYIVQNAPISTGASQHLGSVLLLHCVTEEKAYEQALGIKNSMLTEANIKLENLVRIAGILEAERARADMLRRVQLELTDYIEEIIKDMEKLDFSDRRDIKPCRDDIESIIKSLRTVYKNVRNTIQSI